VVVLAGKSTKTTIEEAVGGRWCMARGTRWPDLLFEAPLSGSRATPNRYPRRSQYKYTKKPHRLRNWPAYESALRKRGDLTLWFSTQTIQAWHVVPPQNPVDYIVVDISTLGVRLAQPMLHLVRALLATA
jgi:hypothetical protein